MADSFKAFQGRQRKAIEAEIARIDAELTMSRLDALKFAERDFWEAKRSEGRKPPTKPMVVRK
jgi:hypothetical protein